MLSSKYAHVIGKSPDDALMISYLLFVQKSIQVPGHLSGGGHSEGNITANALISPHFEDRNSSPRCTV